MMLGTSMSIMIKTGQPQLKMKSPIADNPNTAERTVPFMVELSHGSIGSPKLKNSMAKSMLSMIKHINKSGYIDFKIDGLAGWRSI